MQREPGNIPEGAVQQINHQMCTETMRSVPWVSLMGFSSLVRHDQGDPFPVLCCAASTVLIRTKALC